MPFKTKKRRKSGRQRGNTTYGHGARKKWKGSGHHGGIGMAGSGKRADQKKISILQNHGNAYFGKKGFSSLKKKLKIINLFYLENHAEILSIKKEKDIFTIDLTKLGIDKILGSGDITKKMNLICNFASKNAISKIEAKGGKVILKNKLVVEETSNA